MPTLAQARHEWANDETRRDLLNYIGRVGSSLGLDVEAIDVEPFLERSRREVNAALLALSETSFSLGEREQELLRAHAPRSQALTALNTQLSQAQSSYEIAARQYRDARQRWLELLALAQVTSDQNCQEESCKLIEEVEKVGRNTFWHQVCVSDRGVHALTGPIVLRHLNRAAGVDLRVSVGRFDVLFDLRDKDFQVRPYRDNRFFAPLLHDGPGLSHPHIGNDGLPCWGDAAQRVEQLLRDNELAEAFDLLSDLLRSYDDGNPYVALETLASLPVTAYSYQLTHPRAEQPTQPATSRTVVGSVLVEADGTVTRSGRDFDYGPLEEGPRQAWLFANGEAACCLRVGTQVLLMSRDRCEVLLDLQTSRVFRPNFPTYGDGTAATAYLTFILKAHEALGVVVDHRALPPLTPLSEERFRVDGLTVRFAFCSEHYLPRVVAEEVFRALFGTGLTLPMASGRYTVREGHLLESESAMPQPSSTDGSMTRAEWQRGADTYIAYYDETRLVVFEGNNRSPTLFVHEDSAPRLLTDFRSRFPEAPAEVADAWELVAERTRR